MKFSYAAYRELLALLCANGYACASYFDYKTYPGSVILRHDIDNSPTCAAVLSDIERDCGVSSTFFALVSTDFYNLHTAENRMAIQKIMENGSEIGLHFDEKQYGELESLRERRDIPVYCAKLVERVGQEADILSQIVGKPVRTVSMHRPSPELLDLNLHFNNLVNSYGSEFFKDCKYLSDSRRCWREPVEDIIRSRQYPHLHILTHAFWYHAQEESLRDSVKNYICSANQERYDSYADNFRDLGEVLKREEV